MQVWRLIATLRSVFARTLVHDHQYVRMYVSLCHAMCNHVMQCMRRRQKGMLGGGGGEGLG